MRQDQCPPRCLRLCPASSQPLSLLGAPTPRAPRGLPPGPLGRLFGRSGQPPLRMPRLSVPCARPDPWRRRPLSLTGTPLSRREARLQPAQRWGWGPAVSWDDSCRTPAVSLRRVALSFVLPLIRAPCGLRGRAAILSPDIRAFPRRPAGLSGPSSHLSPSPLPSSAASRSSPRVPGPGAARPLPMPVSSLEGQCPPVTLCVQVPAHTPSLSSLLGGQDPLRSSPNHTD